MTSPNRQDSQEGQTMTSIRDVEQPTLWDDAPATMNAVDSPTGRVMRDAPESSVAAAMSFDPRSHRYAAKCALEAAGFRGMTSIEVARILPRGRDGNRQNSNRASSRLGELWESQVATVKREHGVCVLGVCHPHAKPRVIHHPSAPCDLHGRPLKRDGANIWLALAG
jgi:hypothetical protein